MCFQTNSMTKEESGWRSGVANASYLLVQCPAWPQNDVYPFWTAKLLCIFPESAMFPRKAGFVDTCWPSGQHACRRSHTFWRNGTHYTQAYFFASNVKYVLPEMCLFRTSKTMMQCRSWASLCLQQHKQKGMEIINTHQNKEPNKRQLTIWSPKS